MTGPSEENKKKGEVSIPPELDHLLSSDPIARGRYDKLPPSHQRECVEYINEAKREETRKRRAQKIIDMLKASK